MRGFNKSHDWQNILCQNILCLPQFCSVQFSFISRNFIHSSTVKMWKRNPVGQCQSRSVLLITGTYSPFEVWFLGTICHCHPYSTCMEIAEIYSLWCNCSLFCRTEFMGIYWIIYWILFMWSLLNLLISDLLMHIFLTHLWILSTEIGAALCHNLVCHIYCTFSFTENCVVLCISQFLPLGNCVVHWTPHLYL